MTGEATDITVRARYKDLGVVRGFEGVMSKIRSIGRVFAITTALIATASGAMGISLGAAVEKNLTTVGAVAGATAQELAGITAEARRIGATTAFTTAQAAEGMINLARAGLRPQQIIAATADTLKLAGATASDMTTATAATAATLGQFAFKAEQTQRVVDAFVYSTNRSLFNLPSLAEAMKYAGTTAAGLGMSLEDAVTAVSAFANLGLEGSMSGMAFRMAMIQLASGTEQVREALRKAGLAYEDVNPTTHDYISLIDNLGKGHLNAALAVDIFGTRAGLNMLSVIEKVKAGEISLRDFRSGILEAQQGTGLAASQYDKMMDNVAGDWAILKSTLQESFLVMFDDYKGFLRRGLRATTEFVRDATAVYQTLVANWDGIMASMKNFVVKFFTDYAFAQEVGRLVREIWVRMSLSIGDFIWALANITVDAAALVWAPFEAHFDFMLDSMAYKWGGWINEYLIRPYNKISKLNPLSIFTPDVPEVDVPKYQPVMDEYWEKSAEEMETRIGMIGARFKELIESGKQNFAGFGARIKDVLGEFIPDLKAVGTGVQEISDKTPVQSIIDPGEQENVFGLAEEVQSLLDKAEKVGALKGLIGMGIFSRENEIEIVREYFSVLKAVKGMMVEIAELPPDVDRLTAVAQLAEAYANLGDKVKLSFDIQFAAAEGFKAKMAVVFAEFSNQISSGAETALDVVRALIEGFQSSFSSFFHDLVAESGSAMKNFAANIIDMVGKIAAMIGQLLFLTGLGFMSLGWISGGQALAAGLGLMALGGVAQGVATVMRRQSQNQIQADQERQAALREGVARNAGGTTTSKSVIEVNINDNTGSLSEKDKRTARRIVLTGLQELQSQGALRGALA